VEFKQRKTWKNDSEIQFSVPLRTYYPSSLEEIVAIVKEAEKGNLTVRATGSSLSFSDVSLADDFLVMPDKLDKIFTPIDTSLFKDGVDASTLYHFESGVRIRDLNDSLDNDGLALINMGGYDGQTFIGAMSTSTHGSGIEFGPFPDLAQCIEIVADGGVLYRIEPADGITDRAKYENQYPPDSSGRKLVQDDDWFNTVKAGMGCLGVIYSIIIKVRDKFWLKEVRTISKWKEVKELLKKGDVLKNNRHWEVIINPYIPDGKDDHLCLITTRNDVPKPHDKTYDQLHRNFLSEFLASLPFLRKILRKIFKWIPDVTPKFIDEVLEGLRDKEYTNISYKVFNIGTANEIPAYSQEIALPMAGDRYIEAVDRFLEMTRRDQEVGDLYLTSPVALRFVKASPAFLSPQYGGDTCMMEIIVMKKTLGAFQMYERFENELYKYGGRPHWGQVNTLTGSHGLVESMYPEYKKWIKVYKQLNSKGTFDNVFSKRVGFCEKKFEA
jgi:hypothetical protein